MSNVCPTCNTQVFEDLPGGLCPKCLMAAARNISRDAPETAAMPDGLQAPTIEEMRLMFPEMEIVELIGQGGMGAVYKAVERDLDRTVALKVFLYRSDDPEFTERFKREARALARLKHNNIVGVHHIGERDGLHFMIMEFVDGLNLRQLSSAERLDPAQAMQLVPKLCDALQYAHDNGIIHRDIKPENILIDSNGEIKIADFGLAKMTGSGRRGTLTHTKQVMGTWNYMAPEQVERPTEVDHRADIYSLGVVIYEMLTGELPLGRFQAPSEKVQVDVRLDKIVLRALEKEPERRYQQASEFKSGFESVGNYTGTAAAAGLVANNPAPNVQPAPPIKSAAANFASANPGKPERRHRFHICIMGGREKKGRWQVGHPNNVFTMMGGTCLDLTQVEATEVIVNSFVMMGGCEIIVPSGANVDLDGFILMGATENNVKPAQGIGSNEAPMNVRVRSYGLMGGLEVSSKTPKTAETSPPKKTGKRQPIDPSLGGAMDLAYQGIATVVTVAIPILFIMGAMNIITPSNRANWYGIVAAILAGLLWTALPLFQMLFGINPKDPTDQEQQDFDQSTLIGTIIRIAAMVVGFACPILFVTASIGPDIASDRTLRIAAICCIFGCVLLTAAAKGIEEFLYGPRQE